MAQYQVSVLVKRRKSILDPEGKAIEHALHSLEFTSCNGIRVGKLIEFVVNAPDEHSAKDIIETASLKLLSNPIMEDYTYTIANMNEQGDA